jgi:DNA-binding MarR family transcriptional regulator
MDNDQTTPNTHRVRLGQTAHLGLDRILQHQGFSEPAIEALLDFDAQMFRWRSLQNKAEFTAILLQHLNVDIEHGVFLGFLAISRLTHGVDDDAHARAPTIGDVAACLKLDPSRASRIVAELIDKGFVRRDADQADGRRSVLTMTDKGDDLILRFRDAKWKALSTLFNTWSDSEIKDLAKLLRKYLDGIADLGATT